MFIKATFASSMIKIVAKDKTVSPIWNYFGLEAYNDGKQISKDNAICQLWETSVPSQGGSTSIFVYVHQVLRQKEYLIP